MTRYAPRLVVLLLCATTLAGCASTDIAAATGGKTAADAAKAQVADAKPSTDLDSSVRQAQLLRIAGQYDQAIKILSQLMLVAADDARVLNEYGKTLAEQGRASEAVQFLTRATEIQGNDWTTWSAMGVAYDQLGDQARARTAYERALALKPMDASVLNNYALSRMLAHDPEGARQLIARAQSQGGASDPKIARNIALLNELAPPPEAPAAVAATPSKAPIVASARAPQQTIVVPAPPAVNFQPTSAPRPLQQPQPQQAPQQTATQRPMPQNYMPYRQPAQAVVMQRVPEDPFAGPVASAKPPIKLHLPHAAAAAAPHVSIAEASKPDAKGVAIAPLPGKPAAPAKPADSKTADAKPTAKPAPAPAKSAPVKAADVRPAAPVARLDIAPQAKPAKKADVKKKNAVPALRMTADARQP